MPAVVALLSRLFLQGARSALRVALGIACAVGGIALRRAAPRRAASWRAALAGRQPAAVRRRALRGDLCRHRQEARPATIGAEADQRADQPVGPRAGHAVRRSGRRWLRLRRSSPASSWLLLVVYSIAASMVTVWLWMTGPEATCRRRRPASSRCCCRSARPRSACSSSASSFSAGAGGRVRARARRRRAGDVAGAHRPA